MAYWPEKARSELVIPRNCCDGGVFETTRRFHAASSAFIRPARRPTRGSGLGAAVDMLPAGDGLVASGDGGERAHAAAENSPTASDSDRSGAETMKDSLKVTGSVSRG